MKQLLLILFGFSLLLAGDRTIKEAYLQSYNYEQIGKYKDAIKTLSPLYKKYPHGYTINLRLGWLFYLNKNYSDALKYYKKASLIKTYAFEPILGIIRVYLATASYREAQDFTAEILKKDYYNYYANLYMCQALIGQKKYDIAETVANKMLMNYPTDILFLEELFLIYKARDDKRYQDIYNSILILDPNNVLVRSAHL